MLGSEGRTAASQRQYLHFEKEFLHYLAYKDIKPDLNGLALAKTRFTMATTFCGG